MLLIQQFGTGWFSPQVHDSFRCRVMMRFIAVYPKSGAAKLLKAASEDFEKSKKACMYKSCLKPAEEHQKSNKGYISCTSWVFQLMFYISAYYQHTYLYVSFYGSLKSCVNHGNSTFLFIACIDSNLFSSSFWGEGEREECSFISWEILVNNNECCYLIQWCFLLNAFICLLSHL